MNNEEQKLRQYIRQAIKINQNRKLNEERKDYMKRINYVI